MLKKFRVTKTMFDVGKDLQMGEGIKNIFPVIFTGDDKFNYKYITMIEKV